MTVYGISAARDRQGWFLGLTGPQLALVVLAAFPSWLAMAVGAWLYLLALVPAWGIVTALVCVPIRGWSAFQWIGVPVRHWAGAVLGWSTFQSRAVGGDLDLGDGAEDQGEAGEADLPGVLAGIEIHDGPPMAGHTSRPAIIQNQATRTWAATARLLHPGIGLADDADRDLMGAGLAEMLEAATASGQIDLIALQVRTVPDDGTERVAWVAAHRRSHEPPVLPRCTPSLTR